MPATIRLAPGFSYQQKGGLYYLRVRDKRKTPVEKSVSLNTDHPALAAARASDYYRRYTVGEWDPWTGVREGVSVGEALGIYRRERKHDLRPEVIRNTTNLVLRLYDDMDAGLASVSADRMRGLVQRSSIAQATKASYYRNLHAWYAWAKDRRLIARNPTEDVRRPVEPETVPDGLSEADLNRLLLAASAEPWAASAFALIAWTGVRPGEAARLKWEDVRDGYLVVRTRKGGRTKTDKERVVTLTPQAKAVLEEIPRTSAHVLVDMWGRSPVRLPLLARRFIKARDLAMLPRHITLYSMRHTFAAEYKRRGGATSMLQREMGHKSIKTTEKYGYLGTSEIADHTRRIFAPKPYVQTYVQKGSSGVYREASSEKPPQPEAGQPGTADPPTDLKSVFSYEK